MSYITNIIFSHGLFDAPDESDGRSENIDRIDDFLSSDLMIGRTVRLRHVSLFHDQSPAAGKCLEVEVYVAAINYMGDPAKLATFIATLRWYSPQKVQLLAKSQEDDVFRDVPIPWGSQT